MRGSRSPGKRQQFTDAEHPSVDDALPPDGAPGLTRAQVGSLDSKVLVLNRLYLAIRVVSARRAFSLLVRDLAEVITVNDGQYATYDFASWADLAEYQRQFEAESGNPRKRLNSPRLSGVYSWGLMRSSAMPRAGY